MTWVLHIPSISHDPIVRIEGYTWKLELEIGKDYRNHSKVLNFEDKIFKKWGVM